MSARVARSCSTSASHACACSSTSIPCAAASLASTASSARAAGSSPSDSASASASSVPGRQHGRSVSIIDIRMQKASHAREAHMPCRTTPRRNRRKAFHSCTVHLEAAELRPPPSHQLARLGRTRRRSTHGYLEHRLKTHLNSMVKMTPTCVIVLNGDAVSDFQSGRRHSHWEGGEQSSGSTYSKETGERAAPSSGASSDSVAIVRPWLPSSESESSEPGKSILTHYSNTSCHVIPTARPHTHGR
jgi:hypothetical protein